MVHIHSNTPHDYTAHLLVQSASIHSLGHQAAQLNLSSWSHLIPHIGASNCVINPK